MSEDDSVPMLLEVMAKAAYGQSLKNVLNIEYFAAYGESPGFVGTVSISL